MKLRFLDNGLLGALKKMNCWHRIGTYWYAPTNQPFTDHLLRLMDENTADRSLWASWGNWSWLMKRWFGLSRLAVLFWESDSKSFQETHESFLRFILTQKIKPSLVSTRDKNTNTGINEAEYRITRKNDGGNSLVIGNVENRFLCQWSGKYRRLGMMIDITWAQAARNDYKARIQDDWRLLLPKPGNCIDHDNLFWIEEIIRIPLRQFYW